MRKSLKAFAREQRQKEEIRGRNHKGTEVQERKNYTQSQNCYLRVKWISSTAPNQPNQNQYLKDYPNNNKCLTLAQNLDQKGRGYKNRVI